MMYVMERRYERPMRMTEHAVNDVLDQRPREQTSREYERIDKHRL